MTMHVGQNKTVTFFSVTKTVTKIYKVTQLHKMHKRIRQLIIQPLFPTKNYDNPLAYAEVVSEDKLGPF